MFLRKVSIFLLGLGLIYRHAIAAPEVNFPVPPGEESALPHNLIEQAEIASGNLRLREIRKAGAKVFTVPFNRYDGLGDGPPDVYDDTKPFPFRGDRAPLQNRTTMMLRINGLDAQSCLECHSAISNIGFPRFGIGGHGGISASAMPFTQVLDVDANNGVFDGVTETTGRVINPPFIFGAGGVELLAKEMTRDLQSIKTEAENEPLGTKFDLLTKGIEFGTVTSNGDGTVDIKITNDLGIDQDLVVRPFGRKGDNFSIRDFDRGAMAFHFGIQSLDVFDAGTDPDGDGIIDELTIGEMSALSVFLATLPSPVMTRLTDDAFAGELLFDSLGCANCHVPELHSESKYLTQSFPDIATDPDANVFMSINLRKKPSLFRKSGRGIVVPLFSDLKRHNMGSELAETTGSDLDPFFITARLWGIADSAPYLHDGRAATLTEAILAHGGEALVSQKKFKALADQQRIELLSFLRSLKLPNQRQINNLEKLIRN